MPDSTSGPAASKLQQKRGEGIRTQEKVLIYFIKRVAFMEWAGNASGAVSFLWATVVLFGGFFSLLEPSDFWSATAIIFIEAFRHFNRENHLYKTSLFNTTKAISIRFPLGRMLQQRHEFYANLVMSCMFVNIIIYCPYGGYVGMVLMVPIILSRKLKYQVAQYLRRHQLLLLWGLLIGVLIISCRVTYILWKKDDDRIMAFLTLVAVLPHVMAVLLLNVRPQKIVELINRSCVCMLLHLAKVIVALCLVGDIWSVYIHAYVITTFDYLAIPLSMLVLPICSLQTLENCFLSHWIDIGLVICVIVKLMSKLLSLSSVETSSALFVVSLIGNLQVPASITRIVVSAIRLHGHNSYVSKNLVLAVKVFYYLVLSQGILYLVACLSEVLSIFLRRCLVRRCGFSGEYGIKFVDLYYDEMYTAYSEGRVPALGNMDLTGFAMEAINSESYETQLNGLRALHTFLSQDNAGIVSRITTFTKTVNKLICMLGWTDSEHEDIRMFAAMITAKLAWNLRIYSVPGAINIISSLLNSDNQHGDESDNYENIKDYRYAILGLLIFQRISYEHYNCAEMSKTTDLLAKVIGLMSCTTNASGTDIVHQRGLIIPSMNLVRTLASTGGKIGVQLRKELSENPLLLSNLIEVLDDSRSGPELWEPTMDIISKLSMDMYTRQEIGRISFIREKLMQFFLGRDVSLNTYYDRSLRRVAGDALAMLTMENTFNSLAILKEPGYQLIRDLRDMILEENYRIVSTSILLNLCELSRDELSHPASHEQLSSPIPVVVETLMRAEGKELEVLIGLTSRIHNIIPQCFAQYMESLTTPAPFIRKLVDALNVMKKPSTECPRMRRFTVELAISIVECCPRYAIMFRDHGMMEALYQIEKSPSRVENYILFFGGEGVVSGKSIDHLSTLVARAKEVLRNTRPRAEPANHA